MARKKKASLAEDIVSIGAKLPWWLGVALAAIVYVVLHHAAQTSIEHAVVSRPQDMSLVMASSLWSSLAGIGQYLLPMFFLIGAAASVLAERRRGALLDTVIAGDQRAAQAALNTMTWNEFEQVVGQWFRLQGFGVAEHGGAGPDGGIDLVLTKDCERFLVQCKQWRATKVGVTVVRELYGVMAAQNATVDSS